MTSSYGTVGRVNEVVNAAYRELRQTINDMRDGIIPTPEHMARLFDQIDDHMKSGGSLPIAWCKLPSIEEE